MLGKEHHVTLVGYERDLLICQRKREKSRFSVAVQKRSKERRREKDTCGVNAHIFKKDELEQRSCALPHTFAAATSHKRGSALRKACALSQECGAQGHRYLAAKSCVGNVTKL